MKPILKWAGGKRWLVPYLSTIWNMYRLYNKEPRLVEPFCGSLAVSLGLNPQKALLNDINSCLINFYKYVQKGLIIEIPMKNDEEMYYRYRDRLNELIEEGNLAKEAAEIFYYLNRTCFNGLCRFNQKGKFNVPFGRYKKINYIKNFTDYREVFKDWEFINLDFEEVDIRPNDFIYADPPYDVEFTQYSKEDFTWADQERLVEWLKDHEGPVIISNQGTPRIVELYKDYGYKIKFLSAPRRISCDGDRTPAKEVLAIKNLEEVQY